MTERKLTADERIAAAAARRTDRAEAEAAARKEQFADDLEAIEAIEVKLGARVRCSAQVPNFVDGLPAVVGVRAPSASEHKRFLATIGKAEKNPDLKLSAVTSLGASCWVYPPDKSTQSAMIESNAGLLLSIGNFAYSLGDVELAAEGKE